MAGFKSYTYGLNLPDSVHSTFQRIMSVLKLFNTQKAVEMMSNATVKVTKTLRGVRAPVGQRDAFRERRKMRDGIGRLGMLHATNWRYEDNLGAQQLQE